LPDYKSYYRERTKGSWTLTNGENLWPIADTTAEALKVNTLKMILVIRITLVTKIYYIYGCQIFESQLIYIMCKIKKITASGDKNKFSFFYINLDILWWHDSYTSFLYQIGNKLTYFYYLEMFIIEKEKGEDKRLLVYHFHHPYMFLLYRQCCCCQRLIQILLVIQ
jgi:hypothetical protein